ncbi:SMI1/KNR4 family protein [Cellulomonas sp. P22]|uniref:SMI1/KNR4 family protein n=1 Tax=Cellulomonas sp. P22 TaxID=3373189 RepID=UPI00378E5BE3
MVKASMRLTQAAPAAYPLSVPHIGAGDESITAAAARLGKPLDRQHETLLRFANGWESAFLSGNLLSAEELGQGLLWAEAEQSLDAFYDEGDSAGWPARDELVPIHVSPYDTDVMALWMGGPVTENGHPVVYFSGEPIDLWPNVCEWWLAMLVLQEKTLEHVTKLGGQTTAP